MELYKNFIGIDIGKLSFVVAEHQRKSTKEYENTTCGIKAFISDFKSILKDSLCVLEATGGYEMRLLLTLCDKNFAVHRANTRKVKHFIYSFGERAKTDRLDAKALSLYGYERQERLQCFTPDSKQALELFELVQRRHDLKQMLVAEKNRIQAPRANTIKRSCLVIIDAITQELTLITSQISDLIEQDPVLKSKKTVLKTIPGVGEIVANELLVLLPELGTLNRREIASLAGVAPKANESGLYKGYRSIKYGRDNIRPILFMAAMAARNSHSSLKGFYLRLIHAGKKKMVALTALMRKIIIIANARVRDMNNPMLTIQ